MKDFNQQLDEIRTQVIEALKSIGDYVLLKEEVKDEMGDAIFDLPIIRTINKYDQMVWFAVSKMSIVDDVVVFDCFERELADAIQFSVKDVPLDELIDIYNFIQFELQNA